MIAKNNEMNNKKILFNIISEKLILIIFIFYGVSLIAQEKVINEKKINNDVDLVLVYMKNYKYDEAIKILEFKLQSKNLNMMDIFNLSKCYYITTDEQNIDLVKLQKADSLISIYVKNHPDSINGFILQARINYKYDLESINGNAKPYYEKVINIGTRNESVYINELIEAYDYLAYHNLITKKLKNAKQYYLKILKINPDFYKAKFALESDILKNINDAE